MARINESDYSSGRKEIRLLGNSLINKIAAGEVVDRPMSVVKELVENSIDAGASMISIEVLNGGIDMIRVTDNGSGIPGNEVRTAFERHATSKLAQDSDLDSILTLGFRGEALPSIAAVSRVEMITRHNSGVMGKRIEIDGGVVISEQDIGAVPGTTFVVRKLFYNVPARYKFLKKPSTEGGYITDLVGKLALGNPGIAFKYIINDSISLQTKGNSDLKTVIAQIYGKEISGKILEIKNESGDGSIKIYGYAGKPEIARGNRAYGSLFVNGRYVKSNHIQAAVEDAYKTRLMNGKFPVYVINIDIDPKDVDANVHPAKTEVRFSKEDDVCSLIQEAVTNALKDNLLIPEVKLSPRKTYADEMKKDGYRVYEWDAENEISMEASASNEKAIPVEAFVSSTVKNEMPMEAPAILYVDEALVASKGYITEGEENHNDDRTTPTRIENSNRAINRASEQSNQNSTNDHESRDFLKDYKIIGSVFGTYIMVEHNDQLLIIDQHAAHERVLYEALIKKMDGPLAGQSLLTPISVRVNQNEKQTLLANMEMFRDMGFEIDEFGEQYVIIRTLPFIFGSPVKSELFIEILDKLEEYGKTDGIAGGKREAIAQAACKAAVKAGDRLNEDEIKELIDKILCMENPFSCPHGRPTIIELSRRELEKRFKRVL